MLNTGGTKETFTQVLKAAAGLFPGQKLFPRRPMKDLLPRIPQDQGTLRKATPHGPMAKYPFFMLMKGAEATSEEKWL